MCFELMNKWIGLGSAITGFWGTVLLGISSSLIPWGLRLPKDKRRPFKARPIVTNGSCQATTSWQEWWGSKFRVIGWILLCISFFIDIIKELS